MAQFKKAESFEDEIELLDESGKVVRTIHVSISLDDLLGRYNEMVNALNAAAASIAPSKESTLEEYGQIVMQLLRLIFGADGPYDVILANIVPNYLNHQLIH